MSKISHTPGLRVALVCDWMVSGGAEQVVEQLAEMFPDAPIYTSYCSPQWRERLGSNRVRTGILQHWPFSKLRKFIPVLRIWWFSRLRLEGYDLVISSSGAEAKGIKVGNGSLKLGNGRARIKKLIPSSQSPISKPLHVAYIHAPTHYYWRRYDEYMREPGWGAFDWLGRLGLRVLVGPLRKWDYRAAQRPDQLIANSAFTKEMIKKYYDRESIVIHPSVDVEKYKPIGREERTGFIVVGRQTPYKRIDLAVRACMKLKLPLTVVGDGPDHQRLVRLAGPTVTFLKNVPESEKIRLLQTHAAFIFPNEDDFGISAVEAMAAGCPVIALRAGGALDYIVENETGLFFNEQTPKSLESALRAFQSTKFKLAKISARTARFSINEFHKKIYSLIKQILSNVP